MKPTIFALAMVLMASACLCFGGNKGVETNLPGGEGVETTLPGGVTTTMESGGISDRLADLATAVASGQSYKCTYTAEGFKAESWIKGDKYSSELKTNEGDVIHSISDGTWAYTWVEGQTQGMKMRLSDFKTQDTGGIQNLDYADMASAIENAMNVDCRPAVLQDSLFTPPSNIKFQDVGELMRQMQGQMNASGRGEVQDTCSYCSMITDEEARQECLKNC